jgi:CRP-like cAMP-binding protein
LLHGIGLTVLAELTDDDAQVDFAAGETLWNCGDEATFLAVVVRGNILCTAEDSTLAFKVAPGGVVGADAACGGRPYLFGAVAEENASVLRIDTSLLIDLAEDHFDLGLRMLAHLAREVLRFEDCRTVG